MAQIHVIGGAGESLELPAVRKIRLNDLSDALAKGWVDFSAMPSHAIEIASSMRKFARYAIACDTLVRICIDSTPR